MPIGSGPNSVGVKVSEIGKELMGMRGGKKNLSRKSERGTVGLRKNST